MTIDVAAFVDEGIDVLLVVGLLLRFQILALDALSCSWASVTPFQAVALKDLSLMPPVSVTWQALNSAPAGGSGLYS